jgi:hypothetical protein
VALEAPRFRGGGEEGEVLNDGVVNDHRRVVKVKGHIIGIGICDKTEENKQQIMQKRFLKGRIFHIIQTNNIFSA